MSPPFFQQDMFRPPPTSSGVANLSSSSVERVPSFRSPSRAFCQLSKSSPSINITFSIFPRIFFEVCNYKLVMHESHRVG